MSFELLKKNRQDSMAKLVEASSSDTKSKNSFVDDRFWTPVVDKAGNGYAVLRFLPSKNVDDLPWARYWDHGFQGPTGRWYIEKSLTSVGQTDPVSELNSVLWNSGREEDKELARTRKRRLHHVCNILVVSDPANPQNEGKVFLFKFGKKIMDKIMDLMQPQFQDEKPVNPFDFWGGANFKLKIRNFENYRNYDKSEFESASPLLGGDDAALSKVFNKLHCLKEYSDPTQYKSYADLAKKLGEVLGEAPDQGSHHRMAEEPAKAAPQIKATSASAPFAQAESKPVKAEPNAALEDDTDWRYFAKLANS